MELLRDCDTGIIRKKPLNSFEISERKNMIGLLKDFMTASYLINEQWGAFLELGAENYPFAESFDEVNFQIISWATTFIEELKEDIA